MKGLKDEKRDIVLLRRDKEKRNSALETSLCVRVCVRALF